MLAVPYKNPIPIVKNTNL